MEENTIHIFGWRIGARTMAAIAELRNSTALGHLGAKNAIYDVVGGVSVDVSPLHGIDPIAFAERLTECGFVTAMRPPIDRQPATSETEDFDTPSESAWDPYEILTAG